MNTTKEHDYFYSSGDNKQQGSIDLTQHMMTKQHGGDTKE
jgi:hypothetical protein